jgi:hypothetical protein
MPLGLLAGLAAVIGLLLLLAVVLWPRPAPPRPCVHAAQWIAPVSAMAQAGRYDTAMQVASTALASDPRLCATDRTALEHSVVADGLQALLNLPYDPHDAAGQELALTRLHQIQTSAALYHVGLPLTDRQLASAAYRVGEFLVSKDMLDAALQDGQATPDDASLVQLYASSAYNAGVIMASWGDQRQRREGESLWVLSAIVSQCDHLADRSALAELRRQGYSDPRSWPQPTASPLLGRCGRSTSS